MWISWCRNNNYYDKLRLHKTNNKVGKKLVYLGQESQMTVKTALSMLAVLKMC
jgi:hypothetical protein